MTRLRLAAKGAAHGHAVEAIRGLRSSEVGQGRQHIPMRPGMIADAAGRDGSGPARDHRHPNAAFVQIALDAAKTARTLEKGGVGTAFLVRTVVAGEHDQRLTIDPPRAQPIDQGADVAVHARDHGREGCMRGRLRAVAKRDGLRSGAARSAIRRGIRKRWLGKQAAERGHGVVGYPQLGVGHRVVQVDEEWTAIGAFDEGAGFLREQIVDIVAIEIDADAFAVAPQVIGEAVRYPASRNTSAMVTSSGRSGTSPPGMPPLPRIHACPKCSPVISVARDGAHTVLPE